MTEEPQSPQDEAPEGDEVTEPQPSADPGEAPAEQPAVEPTASAEEPAAEEPAPAADEPAPAEEPAPAAEEPAPTAEEPTPAAEAPAEETSADAAPAEEQPEAAAGAEPAADRRERPKPTGKRRKDRDDDDAPAVVPGAHLEPDLVLERESGAETADEFGAYAQTYDAGTSPEDGSADGTPAEPAAETGEPGEQPVVRTPLDLAADARYRATGKRKTAVARVILKPGSGVYLINGRPLEVAFPRLGLQRQARQPLETAGYETRMDVTAKIHGGGVSSQAGALRHGIAKALTEADPNLRTELKRHGFLTRDARVKERKKAGLKKARKRPQFSKR